MSDHGFHVHGPHDHEMEHAGQGAHTSHSRAGQLAVMTAILATIGAIYSYMGGDTQADAGLYKNNAAIKKTEAADQWNFYQAKSNKQALAELGAELTTSEDKRVKYADRIVRYEKEKADVKADAEKLDAESAEWDKKSEEKLHLHHMWARATTILQVSIALAAIALLTRKHWMEWATLGVGIVGTALGLMTLFHG